MAITFDAGVKSSFSTTSPNSFTHVVGGSANCLIVITACRSESRTVTGVKYNGVSMTFIREDLFAPIAISIWRLTAADGMVTGSHTVEVTWSGNPTTWDAAIAASFNGVHQTTPIDVTPDGTHTGTSATGSITLSITTVTDGAMLVDMIGGNVDTGASPFTGQTSDIAPDASSIGGSTTDYVGGSYKITTTAGAQTMRWDEGAGGPAAMQASVVALRPAAGDTLFAATLT